MWTDKQYGVEAHAQWKDYMGEYSWGFSELAKAKNYAGDQEILNGLKMYRAVTTGQLPILLLGDAKIRSDTDLAKNFGFASGSDIDDQKLIDSLNELLRKEGQSAVPIVGNGSILNDKKWTPLVNDSFILGGAHKDMEFHLTLLDFEEFDQKLQKKQAPTQAAARVQGPEYYKHSWKLFLIENREILWNGAQKCPRVFARELIGLQAFDYTPVFTKFELGFNPNLGAAKAGFKRYFTFLGEAGFPASNQARILSTVSAFLFGDANALK